MGRLARTGLVGRFALGALAVFAIAGIALWLFVSAQLKAEQEQFAQFHAQFVTRSILDHEIGPNDLDSPMTGTRADELRQLVKARILVYPVVALRVLGPDGTILFSDDPTLVGVRHSDPNITRALGGATFSQLVSSPDNLNVRDPTFPSNIFTTYLPLKPDWAASGAPPTAVVEVLQDYSGVQASFAELSRTLALTLAVGLTVLFILLLPVLRQAAQRLSQQTEALRQNAARLRALNEDLVEASRVKSEFMANISHELRTPLTGIIGFAELLEAGADGDLSARQSEDVAQIETSGRTLLQLIDGILELSRIDAGMVSVATEQFNVAEAVQAISASLESVAKAKGLSLDVDVEAPVMSVIGDPVRVRQILTNLVSNAIKFTSQGQIIIRCHRAGDMTELSVEDTGIGLSVAAAKYIFDGFRQADGSVTRRFGGAGLGLATARRLVELQGGQMGAESVEGKGSRFWFTLRTAVKPERAPSPVPQIESGV
ncbi:MAG TPA: ATP-binding protein [Acidimicrobiales bacterium]|nr:ATP-binding protein [Acidimicrobiales bacterium]